MTLRWIFDGIEENVPAAATSGAKLRQLALERLPIGIADERPSGCVSVMSYDNCNALIGMTQIFAEFLEFRTKTAALCRLLQPVRWGVQ